MGWNATILLSALALSVLLLSGWMHARRGIGPISLIPWDYTMILAAIGLVLLLVHLAVLWRDGY